MATDLQPAPSGYITIEDCEKQKYDYMFENIKTMRTELDNKNLDDRRKREKPWEFSGLLGLQDDYAIYLTFSICLLVFYQSIPHNYHLVFASLILAYNVFKSMTVLSDYRSKYRWNSFYAILYLCVLYLLPSYVILPILFMLCLYLIKKWATTNKKISVNSR